MNLTVVYCDTVEISMDTGPDIANITDQLAQIAQRSGAENGSLHASVIFETGHQQTGASRHGI
jgi:hypothetical protein